LDCMTLLEAKAGELREVTCRLGCSFNIMAALRRCYNVLHRRLVVFRRCEEERVGKFSRN
jgi:hypothetical protein